MASFKMLGENEQNWSEFFQDAPAFGWSQPVKNLLSAYQQGEHKTPTMSGTNPSAKVVGYESSPYAQYFSGGGIQGLTPEQQYYISSGDYDTATGLANISFNKQKTIYDTVTKAPVKLNNTQELLQLFPQAQYLSPEVQQAFANNYRLGLASLYAYSGNADSALPFDAGTGAFQIRNGENDEGRYRSIQTGELSKVAFDPLSGFSVGNATISQPRGNWIVDNILNPIAKPALMAGLTAGAGMGLNNLISGLGQAAGTAGATTGGATGLSSLPTAGTWAQTATPALGAGAGSWTLPSALTGVSGATTAAGGLTLADALAAAPGSGTTTAGAVGTGGTASGGLPNFDLPFQSPGSIQPIGESTGLGSVGSTAPDLGTGMITSPEGLSGLVNGQPIGTALGAATPGTTGGYLVPSLGGEALATTAAAGGLASSSSITDWLGNVFNQGVDKFMSDPLKNTLNLVGGISSYLGNNAQAKALEDYLKQGLSQSDPFGSQRAYYMDRLKNTYTNPEGYLNSPEYSAISKRRLEALERADAAQGRRSQYGARTEKMHEFDLENLSKERAMLAQLAGSGINPSQVSSLLNTLGTGSAQSQANAPGNLLFMLNQIFGGK